MEPLARRADRGLDDEEDSPRSGEGPPLSGRGPRPEARPPRPGHRPELAKGGWDGVLGEEDGVLPQRRAAQRISATTPAAAVATAIAGNPRMSSVATDARFSEADGASAVFSTATAT